MPRTCTTKNKQRKSDAEFEAERRATDRLNAILRDESRQTALELVYLRRGWGELIIRRNSVIPTFSVDRVRGDGRKTGATSVPLANSQLPISWQGSKAACVLHLSDLNSPNRGVPRSVCQTD